MSKGPSQTTSTQSTAPPGYVQDAQQNALGYVNEMLRPSLSTPAYQVAGLNEDQLKAFDLTRDNAMAAFDPSAAQAFMADPSAAAGAGGAAQLSAGETGAFMSPYLEKVLNPTLGAMRDEYRKTNADIGARAASAGSFGGSREAVQRSMLDKSYGDQVKQIVSSLMAQGWDKSAALAQANAQMRQQSGMQGGSQAAQIALANAAAANAQKNSAASQRLMALQALLGIGNQQQALQQKAVDVPMDSLSKLLQGVASVTAGAGNTTTSTKEVPDNTLGTVLGTALTLGKLFVPCDRRVKTDIEYLRTDERTRIPLYSFRYIFSGKGTPKVEGPMADEVEALYPGSTAFMDGIQVIDVPRLSKMIGGAHA